MIIVMDVGNTNMVLGAYEGKTLLNYWRLSTNRDRSSDEYGVLFESLFRCEKLDMLKTEAVVIASVVPPVMYSLEHAVRKYFRVEPMIIGTGVNTGINIKYENPRELGADRIVNAVAGFEIYGGPLIVVDIGTATKFGAISSKGDFLGGVICPGIKISAEALFQMTAKLPRVEIIKPKTVIGRTTVANMQSGLVFGHVGQIDYIVRRMKNEMGEDNVKVVATGGLARLISEESETIDEYNGLLSLEGLRIIYEKNR